VDDGSPTAVFHRGQHLRGEIEKVVKNCKYFGTDKVEKLIHVRWKKMNSRYRRSNNLSCHVMYVRHNAKYLSFM